MVMYCLNPVMQFDFFGPPLSWFENDGNVSSKFPYDIFVSSFRETFLKILKKQFLLFWYRNAWGGAIRKTDQIRRQKPTISSKNAVKKSQNDPPPPHLWDLRKYCDTQEYLHTPPQKWSVFSFITGVVF